MKFLVINGPNLNMMHFTEPGVAGQLDYNGLLDYLELCCTQMGMEVEFFQSNHEGDLIDEIQSAAGRADGIILNPGGYAHYSVAILDALRLCGVPAVEVLLSEPDEHEPFRKTDIVSFGCQPVTKSISTTWPSVAITRFTIGSSRKEDLRSTTISPA